MKTLGSSIDDGANQKKSVESCCDKCIISVYNPVCLLVLGSQISELTAIHSRCVVFFYRLPCKPYDGLQCSEKMDWVFIEGP